MAALRKPSSFFKVMIGDFKKRLRLPPAFVKQLKGKLKGNYRLRGFSGKFFLATIEKVLDGYYFIYGWRRFVKYYSVEDGDFLLFQYYGSSGFDVKIFGKSGCEKKAASSGPKICKPKKARRNDNSVVECGKNIELEREELRKVARSFKSKHPHFTSVLGRSHMYHLVIPKGLVAEYDFGRKNQITCIDPFNRSWALELARLSKDGRAEFRKGWGNFLKGNSLQIGDICVFELRKDGDVIVVHMFRAKKEKSYLPSNTECQDAAAVVPVLLDTE